MDTARQTHLGETRLGWWIGLGGLLLAAMAIAAWLALTGLSHWLDSDIATDSDIVIDKAQMEATRGRLDRVQRVLDSLPDYPGTATRSTMRTHCYTDSGDLFQPSVTRTWSLAGSSVTEITPMIARDLRALGWRVQPKPDDPDTLAVSLNSDGGLFARGSLYVTFGATVELHVRAGGTPPCSLRPPNS